MEKEKVDVGALIDEETKRRLAVMEDENYQWPARAGIADGIAILVLLVICGLLIACCMTGVIA